MTNNDADHERDWDDSPDSSDNDGDDSEFDDPAVKKQFQREYRKAQELAGAGTKRTAEGRSPAKKPAPKQTKGRQPVAARGRRAAARGKPSRAAATGITRTASTSTLKIETSSSGSSPIRRGGRKKRRIRSPTPKPEREDNPHQEQEQASSSDSSVGPIRRGVRTTPFRPSPTASDCPPPFWSGLLPSLGQVPLAVRTTKQAKEASEESEESSEESDKHEVEKPQSSFARAPVENLRSRHRVNYISQRNQSWEDSSDESDESDGYSTPEYLTFPCRLAKMRANAQANGHGADIVQSWESPQAELDFLAFKELANDDKVALIRKEAEDHGMEKPKGYNVSFHYNPRVEYHHFGSSHPMKPWRLTLTKQLILAYGLEYTMDLHEPRPATFDEIKEFHDEEYLSFLRHVTPENMDSDDQSYLTFGFGGESNDCPVFDGLWNYVSLYSGATIHAARSLVNQTSDIAINWSGGLHHAKKNAASGFCYVNDIVLAIQQLLTVHTRVLYIDIDVHHGDGVEEAFRSTDRVFTLSYHKYGKDRNGYTFFPGTGNIDDTGPRDPTNRGKAHCLNIPLEDGIDDEQYRWLFQRITDAVMERYRPEAIVLQCGADSLGGDRLGRFNLNIEAHGYCVEHVKHYRKPLLLVGGGGYTPRNVARTWCHETAVCVGAELHNDLPTHLPYIQAFQGDENGGGVLYPDLHNIKRHENANTASKLNNLVSKALENLRYLEGAPSVIVNTRGIVDEQILKVREDIDRQIREEREMREREEGLRRRRERNVGGRGEHRFRG